MRKTLEELYYGNLRPSEQRITAGSELQRAVDHITALENFVLGFRLGARIMLECMDSGDGDTKELIEHG